MHAYEQSRRTEHTFVSLVDIVTFQLVNLVGNEVPSPEVKVTNAEIHALDSRLGYYIFKNLLELLSVTYVVVNLGHWRIASTSKHPNAPCWY